MKAVIALFAVVFLAGASVAIDADCPADQLIIRCLVNPCRFGTCPNYANAVCRNDKCQPCIGRWFVGEEQVTADCRTIQEQSIRS